MNDREKSMAQILGVCVQRLGGEVVLTAEEMKAQAGACVVLPNGEGEWLLKRFDDNEDALAAVKAKEAELRGEAI